MDDQLIITKANQIADFFTPYTEEEAVAGIAEHIRMFWEPRMKDQLFRIIKGGGEGLLPQVKDAAKSL